MSIDMDFLFAPFADDTLRHALAACVILSLSGAPLGVFLHLRRLALLGDAMSHAVLPGVAIAFMFWGMSLWMMTGMAVLTAIAVAIAGFYLTRVTHMKEDTSFTLIYMLSLAAGVALMTRAGGDDELVHVLFGDTLAIDGAALKLAAGAACVTVLGMSQIYRELIIDCFDPDFLKTMHKGRSWAGQIFFVLMVINLVASFRILGTLMGLGIMILPAIGARFWTKSIDGAIFMAIGMAMAGSYGGLLLSTAVHIPAGPAVTLVTGGFCVVSLIFGRYGSIRKTWRNPV